MRNFSPDASGVTQPEFPSLGEGQTAKLLVESSKLFARTLNESRIYETLEQVVRSTMPCQGIIVSSYSRASNLIRCEFAFVSGEHPDVSLFPPIEFNASAGTGMQSEVIRTGEAKLFSDVTKRVQEGRGKFYQVEKTGEVQDLPKGSNTKTQSAIMAPIRLDEEVIGVVQVMCHEEGAYSQPHMIFVEGLALQMAAALKNAELFTKMQDEISERIRVEQALREREEDVRRLNADLESRVVERTAELNKAISEMESFCYSVSHDLRQPLRGICGSAMMLAYDYGEQLDEEGKQHLRSMANAANRMSHLIDALLNYSRLSRVKMQKVPVDLSELADRVLRQADQNNSRIALIEPGHVVQGDPQLLANLMDSLISNALKFTSKVDYPKIAFGNAEVNGESVFFVKDNGAGFEPEYTHKLFLPFERLHREDEFPGTGIGLANAKRIVERHGGRIWAEGSPSEGATVYFTVS